MLHLNYVGKEIPTVDKLSVNYLSTATLDILGFFLIYFFLHRRLDRISACVQFCCAFSHSLSFALSFLYLFIDKGGRETQERADNLHHC